MLRQRAITLAAGAAGGAAFAFAGLPLPWILGAAFAVMLMNGLAPGKASWPRWFGDAGIVVVAYVLGQRMTLETVRTMAHDLPGMIAAASLWIAVCIVIGFGFARLARISKMDGVLGCMPGGLSQMIMLADEMKGGDPGTVAIMQTSRLVVVLYTVPMLAAVFADGGGTTTPAAAAAQAVAAAPWPAAAGWAVLPLVPLSAWLGRRFKLPAGEFLGPVLLVGTLSAVGASLPAVPSPLLALAQLLIGVYIGMRVQPRILIASKRFGPLALGAACLLVALTAAAAAVLASWTGDSVVTWFLALAPGGLGEVALTALLLHADVQQVTAYQLFRLLFILLLAPPLLRYLLDRGRRSKPAENDTAGHSEASG